MGGKVVVSKNYCQGWPFMYAGHGAYVRHVYKFLVSNVIARKYYSFRSRNDSFWLILCLYSFCLVLTLIEHVLEMSTVHEYSGQICWAPKSDD